MREPPVLLLSCEHGGNRVPTALRHHFARASEVLASHRGYDAGALAVARRLARGFGAPLFAATVSRLVVDLNRNARHPAVISSWLDGLDAEARARLLARWHAPHRARVRDSVAALLADHDRVLHVAVHSFTPVLHGQVRNAEVGLLYDPSRDLEVALARRWRAQLRGPALRVRANYPYRGTADGLTTWLRTQFPARRYAGIELELNCGLLAQPQRWRGLVAAVESSLAWLVARHV